MSAIFYQITIFHQMIALQKLWKIFVQKTKARLWTSKNAQFDIYAITSNFFNKFQWNFGKKKDNYVTNSTTKMCFMKIKATQENW